MRPLRYSTHVPVGTLRGVVPGIKVPRRRVGPPRNCRALLPRPPYPPEVEEWQIPKEARPHIDGKPILEWLTDYQIQGLTRTKGLPGANYWWACGSGKTIAAILWSLSGDWPGKVVVVTRAPAKAHWKSEYERVTTLRPKVLWGRAPQPIDSSTRVVILNWEILVAWVDDLRSWLGSHGSVIYDEIHRAKSYRRTEKYVRADGNEGRRPLQNISNSASLLSSRARRRLGLTATPIANRLDDLWSQLDLIEPWCWGTSWEFVHRYCDAKPQRYGGLDTTGRSHQQELNTRLKEVCHMVSKAQLAAQLPAQRRQLVYLAREDQCRPAAFAQDMRKAAKAGRQALTEMRVMEAASRKRVWLVASVQEYLAMGQKVVIFTGRRNDCERLGESIRKMTEKVWKDPSSRPYIGWAHGGDSHIIRDEVLDAYKDCESGVMIGTHDAWGESVDGLQCTDVAIMAMLPWTPKQITQSEGRFTRHGQDRPVLVLYPVAEGTFDERIADLLLEKLQTVSSTLRDKDAESIAATLAGEQDEDEIIQSILTAAMEG